MDRVRNLINCDQIHRLGYTGRGIGIAILDTGIALHPDYAERIRVFHDFAITKIILMTIMAMALTSRALLQEMGA